MTAAVTLSKGYMNVYGANNLNVGNIGQMTGSAAFTLSGTSDNNETVFNVIQPDSTSRTYFNMAGNDGNLYFEGYGIDATFANEASKYYHVELNTVGSVFDFSNTRSGAMVETTAYSAGNVVQLGGGTNYLKQMTLDGSQTLSGENETFVFNNQVIDSGYSNTFISSYDSQTHFLTSASSQGAYMQGGGGRDVFDVYGTYGTFNGVTGYNIFNMAGGTNMYDHGAMVNVAFGGNGFNVYNDKGMDNMYQGAYALYGTGDPEKDRGIQKGYDVVRMNGYYGIARFDTSVLAEGVDSQYEDNGFYNTGFTSDEASFDYEGRTYTVNYKNLLNGTYKFYQRNDGTNWTLRDFFGAQESPVSYAGQYSYSLLSKVLDA